MGYSEAFLKCYSGYLVHTSLVSLNFAAVLPIGKVP